MLARNGTSVLARMATGLPIRCRWLKPSRRVPESGTDFWGVYKETNLPFFYGSDRNGGLYVFKEQGSGSGK